MEQLQKLAQTSSHAKINNQVILTDTNFETQLACNTGSDDQIVPKYVPRTFISN